MSTLYFQSPSVAINIDPSGHTSPYDVDAVDETHFQIVKKDDGTIAYIINTEDVHRQVFFDILQCVKVHSLRRIDASLRQFVVATLDAPVPFEGEVTPDPETP